MMNSRWNNVIRWCTTLGAGIALVVYLSPLSLFPDQVIGVVGVKMALTRAAVWAEQLPWKSQLLLALHPLPLLALGVPTLFSLTVLTICHGPLLALLDAVLLHLLITTLIVKTPLGRWLAPNLGPDVEGRIRAGLSPERFAFWGRLFILLPLRQVDFLLVRTSPPSGAGDVLLPSFFGTLLREGCAMLFLVGLINLLKNFRPFPEADLALFFGGAVLLIISTLLPKIPELLPGPPDLHGVLDGILQEGSPVR